MKIICDNKIPFIKGAFEPYAEVVYLPGAATTAEVVKDADAIVTRTRTRCNASLLEGSSVKVIATATIGFDHIDTGWCEQHGIVWENAPGCNSWSVKQYIASALNHLAKKHQFQFDQCCLGVIGVGNVGKKVAEVAQIMGFKVLLNDPPRAREEGEEGFVSLDEILERCDIITVHAPLNREGPDATYHLFDQARLNRLNKRQILINSSRGEVVDNQALKRCLLAGSLKDAILDVWEGEPNIDEELVNLLGIATPHIAGYSADGKANGTRMSVHTVAKHLQLPLLTWQPESLPHPSQALCFELDATGKSCQEVLSEAILYTYDIADDDARLRQSLDTFEQQRGNYPIRREFTAFHLSLKNGNSEMIQKLSAIGFQVSEKAE